MYYQPLEEDGRFLRVEPKEARVSQGPAVGLDSSAWTCILGLPLHFPSVGLEKHQDPQAWCLGIWNTDLGVAYE